MVKTAFGRYSLIKVSVGFGWFNLIPSLFFLGLWVIIPLCGQYKDDSSFAAFLFRLHDTFLDDSAFLMFIVAAVSVSLLWGINMNQRLFMIPWLCFMAFLFPLMAGLSIFQLFYYPYWDRIIEVLIMLICIIFSCTMLYFWYIVYSLYQKMTVDEKLAKDRQRVELVHNDEEQHSEIV